MRPESFSLGCTGQTSHLNELNMNKHFKEKIYCYVYGETMLYKALFTRQFSMHDTAEHVMTSVNRPERSSGSTTVAVIREGQTTPWDLH